MTLTTCGVVCRGLGSGGVGGACHDARTRPLPDEVPYLIPVVLMMLVILLLAAAVVLYVAYPHRGESVPAAPWLGRALQRGAERLPHIDMDTAR